MNPRPLTHDSIDSDINNHTPNEWFYKALKDFLKELENWSIETNNDIGITGKPMKDGAACRSCDLSFYYYFSKGGGYKNAIWIKVNNIHSIEVWFRIGFAFGNADYNKMDLYSECSLDCPGLIMKVVGFSLPFKPSNTSSYKTEAQLEYRPSFEDLIKIICTSMPCACSGKCKSL